MVRNNTLTAPFDKILFLKFNINSGYLLNNPRILICI